MKLVFDNDGNPDHSQDRRTIYYKYYFCVIYADDIDITAIPLLISHVKCQQTLQYVRVCIM